MFGFWKLGRVDWTLDDDDMPCEFRPERPGWQHAPPPPTERPDTPMVWEHAPAAKVEPSSYATTPRSPTACGFVWSSLVAEIERDNADRMEVA